MKSVLLLSLLLAMRCYAPSPLFFAQNPQVAPSFVNPAAYGTVAWWYDMAQESYADGASVSNITDRAGSFNMTQSTVAARPVFSTSGINSKPAIVLDGVDDHLSVGSTPTVTTVVIVAQWNSGTTYAEGVGSIGLRRDFIYDGAGVLSFSTPPAIGSPAVIVYKRIAGTSWTTWVNNTKNTFGAGPFAMSGTHTYGTYNGISYAASRIGWGCGFSSTPSDATLESLIAELKTQFGIP